MMKIRKKYILVINPLLMVAYYKKTASDIDVSRDSIVDVWDCTLGELKRNIRILERKGFHCLKSKR